METSAALGGLVAGELLALALALGMIGLGVAATVAPGPTSALYGVPQRDVHGHAWVRAAGLRDLALAGVLAALLVDDAERAAAFVCLATAGIAVADAVNVVVVRGFSLVPLSVHASGIGVGVLAAILLLP